MNLSQDLKDLLADFSRISTTASKLSDDNEELKKLIVEKDKLLEEKNTLCSNLELELRKKQEILDLVHKQLSIIPDLKENCDKHLEEMKDLQTKLGNKDNEMSRLKKKHLTDLNSLRLEIEEERKKSQEEENKRILELEEFFKHAQSTEISSLLKKTEREKQLLREEMNLKEEELNNVKTEHNEELEKLKIQLVAAKSNNDQLKTSNLGSEFYRKKILSLQEHYEKQIQEILASQTIQTQNMLTITPGPVVSPAKSSALTFPTAKVTSSTTKKKKVTFKLSSSSRSNKDTLQEDMTLESVSSSSSSFRNRCKASMPSSKYFNSPKLNEDFWKNLGSEAPTSKENDGFLNNNRNGTSSKVVPSSSLQSVVPPSPLLFSGSVTSVDSAMSKKQSSKFTNMTPSKVSF